MLLPEYLDYYTTACIWRRMITIKQKNCQPVDKAEMEILNMIHSRSFYVPKPIMLQSEQLGNVVTTVGQHLFTTFPTLPQEQIYGGGGNTPPPWTRSRRLAAQPIRGDSLSRSGFRGNNARN